MAGIIAFKLYRDLSGLRAQLETARAQINTQITLRERLLNELQGAVKSQGGGPALVGTTRHSLLAELKSAEEKIVFARDYYNETARAYEDRLKVFPYSMIASSMNLHPCENIDLKL